MTAARVVARDWLRVSSPTHDVELLEANFAAGGYARHRHDTYGISVTDRGHQRFDYRGRAETSVPGQVTILHPDEWHDGRAGTPDGLRYRIVHLAPHVVASAIGTLGGDEHLPFVREPVVDDPDLATAVAFAFAAPSEELAWDDVIHRIADGLLRRSATRPRTNARTDVRALDAARDYLRSARHVVRSSELERITGLTRYELTRQFRQRHGTSPYRYSLLRRLDFARDRLAARAPIAAAALDAGFADQAHLTRMFSAAYGVTPARYAKLAAARPA